MLAGDLLFGPVGMAHEVLTTKPSLAMSANYFPRPENRFDPERRNPGAADTLITWIFFLWNRCASLATAAGLLLSSWSHLGAHIP